MSTGISYSNDVSFEWGHPPCTPDNSMCFERWGVSQEAGFNIGDCQFNIEYVVSISCGYPSFQILAINELGVGPSPCPDYSDKEVWRKAMIAAMKDWLNEVLRANPNSPLSTVVQFYMGSCTEKIEWRDLPDNPVNPDDFHFNMKLLTSAINEVDYVRLQPFISEIRDNEIVLNVRKRWSTCIGATCCKAQYDINWFQDFDWDVVKMKRGTDIEGLYNIQCIDKSVWSIHGCVPSCDNLFEYWEKYPQNINIQISPNPTSSWMNIRIDGFGSEKITYKIFDLQGNAVTDLMTINVVNDNFGIDPRAYFGLRAGSYRICIYLNNIQIGACTQFILQ